MTEIAFDYEPREVFKPFHNRTERWSCLVAHRRCGKTVACINDLIARALYTPKKNARYAYIAPYYRQAKDVAWTYLKDFAGDAITKIRESDLRVELFNGAWITLYGADNPDALRGLYFDGVILDEYGDCRPSLWGEVVLPTLADRRGWAVFIGTPKGKNHFHQVYKRSAAEDNWFSGVYKASSTGILPEEELREMRALMSEEQYEQELECSFEAAVLGTYYAKIIDKLEKNGQIGKVPWDPEFPVFTAADLGYKDSTAFWFWQTRPDGIAVIDYEEAHSQPLQYYFDMLDYKPYEYETIWLPHDAKAKSLQTGRSTIEQFLAREYPVRIAPKLKVQHGIDAARLVLPQCHIDAERCGDGIEALRAYRRKFDEVKRVFSDAPLHDWASNGADGFRYLSLVVKDSIIQQEQKDAQAEFAKSLIKPPEYRLNDLFQERERRLSLSRGRI